MSNNLKTYKDIDRLLIAIPNQQSAAGRMVMVPLDLVPKEINN